MKKSNCLLFIVFLGIFSFSCSNNSVKEIEVISEGVSDDFFLLEMRSKYELFALSEKGRVDVFLNIDRVSPNAVQKIKIPLSVLGEKFEVFVGSEDRGAWEF